MRVQQHKEVFDLQPTKRGSGWAAAVIKLLFLSLIVAAENDVSMFVCIVYGWLDGWRDGWMGLCIDVSCVYVRMYVFLCMHVELCGIYVLLMEPFFCL